jgi:endonuclease/exonuclease/phosphatase (EEP) superfamily protein YafD
VAIAHPLIMTAAVVLTANHWWLDAFAAAALVVLVVGIDLPIQRWLELRKSRRRSPKPTAISA